MSSLALSNAGRALVLKHYCALSLIVSRNSLISMESRTEKKNSTDTPRLEENELPSPFPTARPSPSPVDLDG